MVDPSVPEPKRWAGKYETPEALEQGHMHLQDALTERNQRIEELEAQLGREQEDRRVIPQGPRRDPYNELREIGVPPEAIDEIVQQRVAAVMDPYLQSMTTRQQIERQYPDFGKMEEDVAKYIASVPDLRKRYQTLYKSDQLGAIEWALSKYHAANSKPQVLAQDTERLDAMVPGAGAGGSRGADLGNEGRERLQKAYEYGVQYGDWDPYMKVRLEGIIPDGHMNPQEFRR